MLPAHHMQQSLTEVDLLPAQGHQFGNPKGVAVSDQDQCGIPVAVPTGSSGLPSSASRLPPQSGIHDCAPPDCGACAVTFPKTMLGTGG